MAEYRRKISFRDQGWDREPYIQLEQWCDAECYVVVSTDTDTRNVVCDTLEAALNNAQHRGATIIKTPCIKLFVSQLPPGTHQRCEAVSVDSGYAHQCHLMAGHEGDHETYAYRSCGGKWLMPESSERRSGDQT